MALDNFRVLPDDQQIDSEWVTILADDDKRRIIARVTREGIEDRFNLVSEPDSRRIQLVRENLVPISAIIEQKIASGDHVAHTDRLGITSESNRLVIVKFEDLSKVALTGSF